MMPEPMPVATFTNSRSETSGHSLRCSPRAMMLTSLSTSTGASKWAPSLPATSASSQPGMMGGLMGRPELNSTGPGNPTPTLTSSRRPRPEAASISSPLLHTQASTVSGPRSMGSLSSESAMMFEARSVRAMRACVAPRSTARTTRLSGEKAKTAGGLPPVEWASPTVTMRPAVMSMSMRVATVERAWPVTDASSARVRGAPSLSIWKSSPGPVWRDAGFGSCSTTMGVSLLGSAVGGSRLRHVTARFVDGDCDASAWWRISIVQQA